MAACSIQATLASILQRLRILEENQSRCNTAMAKMRVEMENASSRIQELEFSHESALREINTLLQRFGEQMATSRRKEQEKLRSAFLRLREEIEEERNTCRLLKLENKKLMKELEEANSVAADTGEELDRERQARELMEEVCNELAREIGEDKAEVEQLKQEQAKSRELVEEELKMMRMASLWQDERMRAKVSEAQLEFDNEHQGGVPLEKLKGKIEEFVSTVSEMGLESLTDPAHAEFLEEKQKTIIEQAKMLRHAVELSMRQQSGNKGDMVEAQADLVLKEEKILTPVNQDWHTSNAAPNVAKVHEHRELSMSPIDRVELHVKPACAHMLSYSKKPCKDTRRPRVMSAEDRDHHAANAHPQARKPHLLSHDGHGEAQTEITSGRMIVENDHIQALHHSPEQLMYESSKLWFAPEKHRREQGLHSPSSKVRNEPQMDDPRLLKRSFSSARMAPKGLHRKQLSLHFDDAPEENASGWEHHAAPNGQEQSYSEGDANCVCTDGDGREMRQTTDSRRRRPICICTTEQANGVHPWKSPGLGEMINHGDFDHHAEHLIQHAHNDLKSQGVGEAEGEEHSEFDGFYFEPVLDAGALDRHSVVDPQEDQHGVADDDAQSVCSAYKPAQQSKSPMMEATKPSSCGGNVHSSSGYGGTCAKGSHREEGPHKLVVPAPANLVPSVKAQFTSPKSARSVSPSKPQQVLQCFRPPPTSPEHSLASPLFNKFCVKASNEVPQLAVEAQSAQTSKASLSKAASQNKAYAMIGHEEAHLRDGNVGDRADASTSGKMLEEKKGNSLRSELLKAREMDLQQYVEHVHYNMQKQAASAAAAAPPPAAKLSTASSSFRFSPLWKPLTSNSHGSH